MISGITLIPFFLHSTAASTLPRQGLGGARAAPAAGAQALADQGDQELSQSKGRSPTVAELATHLKITEEEVLEGLESANAYSTVSLDAPDAGDDDAPAVADSLGIDGRVARGRRVPRVAQAAARRLPPREKRILLLRFFGNMTQSQIAAELGISQMHVSRLLARTLAQLREGLLARGLSSRRACESSPQGVGRGGREQRARGRPRPTHDHGIPASARPTGSA